MKKPNPNIKPMFSMELDRDGANRESYQLYCGNTCISTEYQDLTDEHWPRRVEGALQLMRAIKGEVKDNRHDDKNLPTR